MNKASLLTVFLAPALLLASAPFAHAQVYSSYGTTVYPTSTYGTTVYPTSTYGTTVYGSPINTSACIQLTAPMAAGTSDYLSGGQVSELQTFLVRDGFLSSSYVTGYYGNLTAGAVAQFQASRGISPTGVVGPLTRAAIGQVSCGTTGINYPTNPTYPTNPIYPINPGGPIQYGYGSPDLNSLSASYNGPNITITLQGYDFDATNNTVYFGGQAITGISSNGSQLLFNVPSTVPGSYLIYVTDSHGTSNSLPYTLSTNTNNDNNCYLVNGVNQCNCVPTVYNSYSYSYNSNCGTTNNQSVTITSVSGSGSIGGSATIYGSGFTTNSNTVYFGGQVISNVYSSNGTSLSFNVPYLSTNYGTYSLYVRNGNGSTSNTIQFTATGGTYTNGQLTISYLSPAQGNIGSQIAIQGSGFSTYGNTVHFGNGGSLNLQSYNNGDTIYYTIPSTVSGCDLTTNGGICAQYIQQISVGSYPIYVTNQSGQSSNTLYFQAQN